MLPYQAFPSCFVLAIFASKSSRCDVSPVLQLPPPPSVDSSRRENTDCAPFIAARGELIAAFASARCPLPMDTPLNAFTLLPSRYGAGFAPKLYLKFLTVSPKPVASAPLGS